MAAAEVSDPLQDRLAVHAADFVFPDPATLAPMAPHVAEWASTPYRAGPLSEAEVAQFWQHGWVIKHGLLPKERLAPVVQSIETVVENVAQELYGAGKIKDLCADAGFYQRLTRIEEQFPNANVLVHKRGVLPPAVADLWSSPPLLSVAQQLLGDEIGGHPVWNLRSKVPKQGQATVPWHQDNAYLNSACWNSLQLTAWVPLIDANMENGCMQVLNGGHRTGKTVKHSCCVGGTWYTMMDVVDAAEQLGYSTPPGTEPKPSSVVTCQVPLGSVLFLNNLIPHRSLENFSQNIRWSLDLRWQKHGEDNGFWGLKPSLPMFARDPSTGALIPDFKADFSSWASVDRNALQARAVEKLAAESGRDDLPVSQAADPFDTTISGPWMGQWPLDNTNRHTEQFLKTGKEQSNWSKS